MEAWTSAIAADVYRSGVIISKRMDIIFGHNIRDGKGKYRAQDYSNFLVNHLWSGSKSVIDTEEMN